MKKEEIATVSHDIALPAIDFSADAGLGVETADKSSFAIPFLQVLQGLSPQLETVEGARPGLLINTITNELYKEAYVIPCAYQRRFLRWAPRSAGGGYKGDYSPVEVETGKIPGLDIDNGQYVIEGDELKDTRNHFILVQSVSGAWTPALVSLTSTQIKKSKRWMSRIVGIEMLTPDGKSFNPPSFSHIYKLSSKKEENAKGSWYGIEVELDSPVSDADVYSKAKAFHDQVASGDVKVEHQAEQDTPEAF